MSRVLVLLVLLLVPNVASAVLMPLRDDGEASFPDRPKALQVVAANLRIERSIEREADGERDLWVFEAELLVRNHAPDTRAIPMLVADDARHTGQTSIRVDGVVPPSITHVPRRDPAMPDHVAAHGRRFTLQLGPTSGATVSIRTIVPARVDALGQVFVEVPIHFLSLWDGAIPVIWIDARLREKAVGLEVSLGGGQLQDEPENRMTWFSRDFRMQRPFTIAYLPAWSALMLVASIEQCPEPWRLVQLVTGRRMSEARSWLGGFDEASLDFCSTLPLVIHGFDFRDDRVMAQLRLMELSRYVPGKEAGASLYRVNPEFRAEALGEVEAMYRNALLDMLDELRRNRR